MFNSIGNIFRIEELKRKVLFTLAILAAYRIGIAIPLPGANPNALKAIFNNPNAGMLGFLDIFSGGAMSKMSIFALGIMPYINASIIMSVVQGAKIIPQLEMIAKEGESGRKKITRITRYFTLALATVQAIGLTTFASNPLPGTNEVPLAMTTPMHMALIVVTLVTGTMFVMWLGEQITEMGIGNGISLLIFAGIVDGFWAAGFNFWRFVNTEEIGGLQAVAIVLIMAASTIGVVWLETAQRRIPVQYAKRQVGRRMMGGATTFLPIKVDTAGVISVIFALSVLSFPMMLLNLFPNAEWARSTQAFLNNAWVHNIALSVLIVVFCYFYNSLVLNPADLAENMKKMGGFVQGIRPGEQTAKYIQYVLERVTLGGALAVVAVAVLPSILLRPLNAPFYFGGTTLLIAVGVSLDTVGQIESYLVMHNYESFAKNMRIKGRWFNVK